METDLFLVLGDVVSDGFDLIEILLVDAGFAVTRLTAGDINTTDTLRTALFDVETGLLEFFSLPYRINLLLFDSWTT